MKTVESIINWFVNGKKILIIGMLFAGLATLASILNNIPFFYNWFEKIPLWNNLNNGAQSIMQISNAPKIVDIDGIQKVVNESGKSPYVTKARVLCLMNTDHGFKEMRDLILDNLLVRPSYEVNAIINEQVFHMGNNPKNPYLAQSIVSFIPVPHSGVKYTSITAEAYKNCDNVATESHLAEWIKSHKKRAVFSFCLLMFGVGFFFQFVYQFIKK